MDADIRATTNQAPLLAGHNVVTSDAALVEAVTRHADGAVVDDLVALGAEAGTAEAREHGMLANRHHPELTTYDRWGNRIDEVEFHPSWHWLMERAVGHGLQAAPWERRTRARARPRPPRGGVLRLVADRAGPRLPDLDDVRRGAGAAGRRGDRQGVGAAAGLGGPTTPASGPRPTKRGALAGMGMTEKQGGSDVRANVTEAPADAASTGSTRCTGTSGSPRRR